MPGALTRWDPFAELAELRSQLDRTFADFGDGHERRWAPAIDVVREDGNVIVHADIPGIKPEDVKIEVEDDVLTISGKREQHEEERGKRFVRRERRYGSFARSIALPAGVQPEKIEAQTHDGVIEVKIPLPQEAKKQPITITPKSA